MNPQSPAPIVPDQYQTPDLRTIETVGCVVCGARIPVIDMRSRRRLYCGDACLNAERRRKHAEKPKPVRHRPTAYERLCANTVRRDSGCWEWQGYRMPFGHGQIQGDDGKVTTTHRVAWSAVHGPIPDGLLVRHKCDNPPCVNPEHLELGTSADNSHDAVTRGRVARGSRHPHTRLTDENVAQIRSEYRTYTIPGRRGKFSNKAELAARYGVSKGHIKEIVGGRERA